MLRFDQRSQNSQMFDARKTFSNTVHASIMLFINGRSSSDPYSGSELVQEGVRASPDPFQTFPGASGDIGGDPLRSTSPPPWFIAEPHTPRVKQDFLVSLLAIFNYCGHMD